VIDEHLRRLDLTAHRRDIDLLNEAALKRLPELSRRGGALGQEEHAARRAVEPVDRGEVEPLAPQPAHEIVPCGAREAVHREPARLVDGDDALVLVQDAEPGDQGDVGWVGVAPTVSPMSRRKCLPAK
jgi:hypothetical protein